MATQTQPKDSLQWMCDVGVSQEDVQWLRMVSANGAILIGSVKDRVKLIQDAAYVGLLGSINPAAASTLQ